MGLPQFRNSGVFCVACGKLIDDASTHGLRCNCNGGRIFAHNEVVTTICRLLSSVGVHSIKEHVGIFNDDVRKRPDV